MKRYHVRLTDEVEHDLIDIFEYIARKDSTDNAYYVLEKLDTLILSLDEQPERGRYPPELDKRGVKNYREVHFKPYRVIYEMNGTKLRRRFLCRAEFIRPVAVGGYPHCGYIRDDRWNGNVVGRMNSTLQWAK